MNRTSSPCRHPGATQTARTNASTHPFLPTQPPKKTTLPRKEYRVFEEWAPESIGNYEMAVDKPVVDPVSPPKTTQRVQRQHHLQQKANSVANTQGRDSNRRIQTQARSSEMFEEWKSKALVGPAAGVGSSTRVLLRRDDKVKRADVASTAPPPQESNGIDHSDTSAVPDNRVQETSVAPPTSLQGNNETGHRTVSNIPRNDTTKTGRTSTAFSKEATRSKSSSVPVHEDNMANEPSAAPPTSSPVPKAEGSSTAPVARANKAKKDNVTSVSSANPKHKRGGSAASRISNKKVNETNVAHIVSLKSRHKPGNSGASGISNNKVKGIDAVASTSLPQVDNHSGHRPSIVGDNKTETAGVTSISSPEVDNKSEEGSAPANAIGPLEERSDEPVKAEVEPKSTCDVQVHRQELKQPGDASAGTNTPLKPPNITNCYLPNPETPVTAPSSKVTETSAPNSLNLTRKKTSKRGRGDEKQGGQEHLTHSRERVQQKADYTAPNGTNFSRRQLAGLERGNKLQGMDKVYFIPCFIEDPWEGMGPIRAV
ncbi:hypothetical protein BJY01DRAFT_243383 [Aspergillus pseudoustus]|uniref:Uncharacterized protein n=1 Tax=Aspergillus pseudoustus TaxID=1810923 RepID=A0ABR4KRM4_9EURO